VPKAGTVLIATRDGILADSLRFSLELEGFAVRLCDEINLFAALASAEMPGCLLLDQDVFERIFESGNDRLLASTTIPVVLLVEAMKQRLLGRVDEVGIARVVEKPLLGRDLLNAVADSIEGTQRSSVAKNSPTGWQLPPFLRSSP
jgi:FixJ family two-component response regulator